jgi:hypothetical protein
MLAKARFEPLAELPRQARHPRSGDLLDADFYQKLSIHSYRSLRRQLPTTNSQV